MKINDKEILLTLEGECDKKNKLLKSEARLTDEEVRRLDSGDLTLEDLEKLLAKKAKIFKYKTQITVHANFPREVGLRVNGYSYLVNNKNGSVGIRYGAIDEVKRQNLAKFLSFEGFKYDKNSTRHNFVLTKSFRDQVDANIYIVELKSRYDYNALRSLIYGHIDIYGGMVWGRYYVELSITVNAIPEKNISAFKDLLGCKSDEEVEQIELQRKAEQDKDMQKLEERRKKDHAEAAEKARIKRQELLAEYREKYTQVTSIPQGNCSLCIIAENAYLKTYKKFTLKNGKILTKGFFPHQVARFSRVPEYEYWNDVMPPHNARETARISDDQLRKYIEEGVVFCK